MSRIDAGRLAGQIAGEVVMPGHHDYDLARRVWNGMIDRRPALIVRCTSAADVAAALEFASHAGLRVAVRGGSHNIAGNATCDDGLVVDLSPMQSVEVDIGARRARAGGGVTWGVFDEATQRHGLATTGGLIPTTGIAGFTLGGGLGHLMRSCGLACDNLLSAEVVTADGTTLRTDQQQHPDLFWALRGGGGNFGVVTEFEFRLHQVGPVLLGGRIAHPLSAARQALRFYRDFCAEAPDSVIVYAVRTGCCASAGEPSSTGRGRMASLSSRRCGHTARRCSTTSGRSHMWTSSGSSSRCSYPGDSTTGRPTSSTS